jgi:ribonuclease HI
MVQMIWVLGQRETTDKETADQLAKTECDQHEQEIDL